MLKTRFALAASALTIALAGCGASTSTTASVNSASAASGSAAATGATTPTAGNATGAPSGGGRPQMQTVTGTAADKASAAALAKYPGTVQRVTKLGTSYVVDVTTSAGATKHVAVSATFAVTGLMTPPTGGAPGGTPPNGIQPKSGGVPATTPAAAASTS